MDAKGCFGPSCGKNFKAQTIDQAFKCSVGAKVKEDYDQCKCDAVQMQNKHTDVLLGFTSLPGMSAPVKRL